MRITMANRPARTRRVPAGLGPGGSRRELGHPPPEPAVGVPVRELSGNRYFVLGFRLARVQSGR